MPAVRHSADGHSRQTVKAVGGIALNEFYGGVPVPATLAALLPPSGYGVGGGLRQDPGGAPDSGVHRPGSPKDYRCPERSMKDRSSMERLRI